MQMWSQVSPPKPARHFLCNPSIWKLHLLLQFLMLKKEKRYFAHCKAGTKEEPKRSGSFSRRQWKLQMIQFQCSGELLKIVQWHSSTDMRVSLLTIFSVSWHTLLMYQSSFMCTANYYIIVLADDPWAMLLYSMWKCLSVKMAVEVATCDMHCYS